MNSFRNNSFLRSSSSIAPCTDKSCRLSHLHPHICGSLLTSDKHTYPDPHRNDTHDTRPHHLRLFLLLWFVYIGAPVQEEDEGIEIAFGEMTETQSYASAAEATELVAPQAVTAPSEPAVPTHY